MAVLCTVLSPPPDKVGIRMCTSVGLAAFRAATAHTLGTTGYYVRRLLPAVSDTRWCVLWISWLIVLGTILPSVKESRPATLPTIPTDRVPSGVIVSVLIAQLRELRVVDDSRHLPRAKGMPRA